MFGTTIVLLDKIVNRFGIEVDYVNLSDINEWKVAIKSNTKMFLLETPSNPLGEVIDINSLSKLSKTNDILLAVDNCLLTPALQKPLDLGADISIQSATKYIDGQGRSLAGAVISNQKIIDEIKLFTRSTGPTLSPFNAWVVLKGLETLRIRMEAHGINALKFANWLQNHKEVKRVFYTGLESHLHHELAKKQQEGFGGIVSFEVQGGKTRAFDVINNVKIMSISANLGDTKTTITHPASTTHGRLSPEQRLESGITDSLLRVSVGLEDIDDLINDMNNALLV
jgi:O-succinylhomoserine sulfhydrylase